jgi:hypothetical protein
MPPMVQPTPPSPEANDAPEEVEDSGSWLDEGGAEPPAERPSRGRVGSRLAAVGLAAWLSLGVALLVALALLWMGGEMHYNNCLKQAEITSPDNSGLSILTRKQSIAKCNRSPF